MDSKNLRRRRSGVLRGFSLVEVLVAIAIVGGLVGLLLPAVQSARESARRTGCLNNLRQIGVGFQNFECARGFFPTTVSGNGARHYWTAQILPYLEDVPLAGIYDYRVDCKDIRNQVAVQTNVAFMCCPSMTPAPRQDVLFKKGTPAWWAVAADYAGSSGPSSSLWTAPAVVSYPKPGNLDGFFKGTIMPGAKGRRVRDITDGTSKSVAIFECAGRPQAWAFGRMSPDSGLLSSPTAKYITMCAWADANQFLVKGFRQDASQADPASQYKSPGPQLVNATNDGGIYAAHPGGAGAALADGSARFLDDSVSADVGAALLTIQAGDAIPSP